MTGPGRPHSFSHDRVTHGQPVQDSRDRRPAAASRLAQSGRPARRRAGLRALPLPAAPLAGARPLLHYFPRHPLRPGGGERGGLPGALPRPPRGGRRAGRALLPGGDRGARRLGGADPARAGPGAADPVAAGPQPGGGLGRRAPGRFPGADHAGQRPCALQRRRRVAGRAGRARGGKAGHRAGARYRRHRRHRPTAPASPSPRTSPGSSAPPPATSSRSSRRRSPCWRGCC